MTKQEMFDKAYIGLRNQGFERCMSSSDPLLGPYCSYSRADRPDMHCAWGHIDPSIGEDEGRGVETLWCEHIGVAGDLSMEDGTLMFAKELQKVHDKSEEPKFMEIRLRNLAAKHQLTVPE